MVRLTPAAFRIGIAALLVLGIAIGWLAGAGSFQAYRAGRSVYLASAALAVAGFLLAMTGLLRGEERRAAVRAMLLSAAVLVLPWAALFVLIYVLGFPGSG
jgi:uncharacterized membrane protein